MNRNRYRLVFDHERNMLVPVCEGMPARRKKSAGKAVVGAAELDLASAPALKLDSLHSTPDRIRWSS